MTVIFAAIFAVAGSVFLALLATDLEGWCPVLARRMVLHATRRLPVDQRDRWREEALADLDSIPGRTLSVLAFAARVLWRSQAHARELGVPVRHWWLLRPDAALAELQPAARLAEHFFYADREEDAASLLAALEGEGVVARLGASATEGLHLVMAFTSRSDEDEFGDLVTHFGVLAGRHRVEYDGHGTYLRPLMPSPQTSG